MASTEEDFPRGGTQKTPQTTKPAKPLEKDNLFETCVPEVKKKRKNKPDDEGHQEKKATGKVDPLKLNAAKNVDILHLKNLKVGTLLLGCIKEVGDLELVVALPSGLTGYLPITNISEAYSKVLSEQLESTENAEDFSSLPDIFTRGRLIRCVVSSLVESAASGHVSLKVSVNPKDVNKALNTGSLKPGMTISGCLESVEDHGYLIDIGIIGTKAFLPKPSAKAAKQELKVGQYMECLLDEVKNEGRLVRVSVDPTTISETVANTAHGWTLSNLCPGLLVNATIKKVTVHGLILEFLSSFSGNVDFMHIDPDKATSYSSGDKVQARILYVDPIEKQVGLSMRSHLLSAGGASGGVLESFQSDRVGEVVEGCKVAAIHYHSGAILELPDGTQAFSHKNNLREANEPFDPSALQAKPNLTCRLTDYSPLEQLHLASLRKTTIEAPFFRYNDLKPGQIVEGTIDNLAPCGLFIRVTDHIKGLVPRIHLADVAISNPEKKFSPGLKVKCRVLSVDVANKKMALTRKKGMVESTLPVFATYADARVGRVAHGFIVCVKDFGCVVRFYGDVKGLVPIRELSTEHVAFPQQLFYVGQVVKAKVLQCDEKNEKLLLSFRAVVGGNGDEQNQAPKSTFNFSVGKNVKARVVSKIEEGLNVAILPEETPAFLPTSHLSDHTTNCRLLWEALQEEDTISDAFCLSKTKQSILLTKKPLLRASLERGGLVTEFAGLRLGLEMLGWVKNIMPYGAFVEFPHGLFGLAPKSAMCDGFLPTTEGIYQLGQTVRAKITNLDEEKRRFLISLKASDLSPGGDDEEEEEQNRERMMRGLQERRAAAEMISGRDDSGLLEPLVGLAVGSRLQVTVGELPDDDASSCFSFSSDDLPGISIKATKHHVADVTVNAGQKVKVVVLHVDILGHQVYVSLLPALLAKRKKLETGSKHVAKVQYMDIDFAVVCVGETAHITIVPLSTHFNGDFVCEAVRPKPGDTLNGKVVVVETSNEALGGLPLVTREAEPVASKHQRKRTISEGRGSLHSFRCGDLVTAVVSGIKPLQVRLTLPGDVTGWAHVSEIMEDPKPGSFPINSVKVGQEVKARVIGGRDIKSHKYLPISHPGFVYSQPVLSLLPRKLQEGIDPQTLESDLNVEELQPGQEIICYASKYLPAIKCLEVAVTNNTTGIVEMLAMTTNAKEAKRPERLVKVGQALKAKVVSVSDQTKRLHLSLTGMHALSPGSVAIASVSKVTPHVGLSLRLPFGGHGKASLFDLSDAFRSNPLQHYHEDQLVRCCILEANERKCQVSLRPSRTHPAMKLAVTDAEVHSIDDLKPSQLRRGYVSAVSDKGIFVRLSRAITGRVEFKKATNYYVSDHNLYSKHIPLYSLLTVKVLSVDKESGHVDLSSLPEDTGETDPLPESLNLPLRNYLQRKRKRTVSESTTDAPAEKKKKKKPKKSKAEENDSGVEVYFREEDTESPKTTSTASASGSARLQVSAGFSWDATLSSLCPAAATITALKHHSEDEEEMEVEPKVEKKKKSRRAQEEESKQEEAELRRQEAELMDPSQRPQSSGAFERLLLASPDSSLLWLQYMAFHLQATEIEQARAVAERALKTISFREEQEKLNVWVALMNLENMYGTDESLQKVFERAVQYCEPGPVHLRLAEIYTQSDKIKEAEKVYKNMVKRFRQDPSVWLSYGTFLVRQGKSDQANALLQRALTSLSNKEHVDLISKFARLEFQHGDTERGKAMFEKVLSSYPKRTDLWSVFIDLMIKHGNQQEVRELFDRVIHLSVAVKRIKFFFKRYLEYEKRCGTPDTIQAVKKKALEYVEAKGMEDAS